MDDDTRRPELAELDAAAKHDRRHLDHAAALRGMEHALILRTELFGKTCIATRDARLDLGHYCNFLAMKCLEASNVDVSRTLLHKAQCLVRQNNAANHERTLDLNITTWNNLACVSRSQGHVRAALTQLEHAMDLEHAMTTSRRCGARCADTYLNACAIESQLGRHTRALAHAQTALIRVQEQDDDESQKMMHITRAMAHHNIAVEHEYLEHVAMSRYHYRKAVRVARTCLGHDHVVTTRLQVSLDAAESASTTTTTPRATRTRRRVVVEKHPQPRSTVKSSTHVAPLEFGTPDRTTKTKTSPSRKDVRRFDSALSAYGRIPGVPRLTCGERISEKVVVVPVDFSSLPSVTTAETHDAHAKVWAMMTPRRSSSESASAQDGEEEGADVDAETKPSTRQEGMVQKSTGMPLCRKKT